MNETLLDSIFSEDTCHTILKNYLASAYCTETKFLWRKFESLSGDVEGYFSDHFSLKITFLDGSVMQEKKFFVKTVLNDIGFLAAFANAMDVFRKECFIYNVVFGFLEKQTQNYKRILPRCYYCDPKRNVLVLEDLSEEGYQLVERLKFYNLEQCKMALKTLSYYHAYSIIFEELKSEECGRRFRLNEEYPDECMDRFYSNVEESSPTAQFLEASVKTLVDLVQELENTDTQTKFNDFAVLLLATLNEDDDVAIPRNKYRMTCTHCDLWSSNIMFKSNANNQLIDCKIIDYQMLNYTLQAYDVELFLHGNTTSELRAAHKGELLRYYYDSFVEILKGRNINVKTATADTEGILSFKDLQETCILQGPKAKIQAISDKALLYLPEQVLQQGANNPDFLRTVLIDERSKHILNVFRTNPEFQTMIKTELLDLYDILIERRQYLIKHVIH